MLIRRISCLMILSGLVNACGVFPSIGIASEKNESSDHKHTKPIDPQPHIQINWQNQFIDIFKQKSQYKHAWALFSYSGWANEGQFLVFGNEKQTGIAMLANPSSKKINKEVNVSKEAIKYFFNSSTKFSKYEDFDTGIMDGVQYEYVHAEKKKDGTIEIKKRIYMNNPGAVKSGENHLQIVKLFYELKEKENKKEEKKN
ncbi:MAG: hypothetical protein R3B45_04350 [Bdellovibrionota bacterium]